MHRSLPVGSALVVAWALVENSAAFAGRPLDFVENLGQWDSRAAFAAAGRDATHFVTAEGLRSVAVDSAGGQGVAVFMTFATGAGEAPRAILPRSGLHHYFRGNDAARWVRGARAFSGVEYREVRPNVDVVVHGGDGGLSVDLRVGAGGAPELPEFRFEGVDRLAVAPDGALEASTACFPLRLTPPRTYASAPDGRQLPVASSWEITGDATARVIIGSAPEGLPLLVDPEVVFATMLGGSANFGETFPEVAVDASGSAYVAAGTYSADFPVTAGALDVTINGLRDVSVTRFTPDGSSIVFSTLFGGGSYEDAMGIALGPDASVHVCGETISFDLPTTVAAIDESFNGGPRDGFVARLSAAGDALIYSTYVGGAKDDHMSAIEVSEHGHAFVAGGTNSDDFPVTTGAFDTINGGFLDAFVMRIAPTGTGLAYSTLLGQPGILDRAEDLALDGDDAIVTGDGGPGFPTTAGAFDTTWNSSDDTFVTRVHEHGTSLVASTFLGGPQFEQARCVALGDDGRVTVAGTTSGAFPTTPGAFDTVTSGPRDAYVSRFSPSLSVLLSSTLVGGTDSEEPRGLAVDASGSAIVCGEIANAAGFPTTPGAWNTVSGHGFLTRLTADAGGLEYSTYTQLGYQAMDVALDSAGEAYLVGHGGGAFPTTPGAFDTVPTGGDVFLAKFDLCPGEVAEHGAGCAGAGGITPRLAIVGCPSEGFPLLVTVSDALGHTPGVLLVGTGSGVLPISGSCALEIAPLFPALAIPLQLVGNGPGGGSTSFSVPAPAVPAAVTVHLQAVIKDPTQIAGLAVTNAVQLSLAN